MKDLKQYYRQIRCRIPFGGKAKKKIMTDISSTVDVYLEENPAADLTSVQDHFGSPQQIASSCVEEMDSSELLHALAWRKKVVKIVAVTAAAALLLWGIVLGVALYDEIINANGYGIVEIHR